MKKLLLITLLIMAGSVIVGSTTSQQKRQNSSIENMKTEKEVTWKYEDEIDEDSEVIIGRTIVVTNHLSRAITWYGKIVENGKKTQLANMCQQMKKGWHGMEMEH